MWFFLIDNYVVLLELVVVVNVVIMLECLLLVKGELGIGKIELVWQVVVSFGLLMLEWNVKLIICVQQGFYEYDVVLCLCDSQLGDVCVYDIVNYICKGKLWQVFEVEGKVVLLIDEIDKVDIEFFNDLLQELDWMEFYVYEIGQMICVWYWLVVIIILNNEKELLDVFLCCCFFYYICFFDVEMLKCIVDVYYFGLKLWLLDEVLSQFLDLCEVQGLKKKFLISEFLDWLKLIFVEDLLFEDLKWFVDQMLFKLYGVLLKNEQDVLMFEWLVFMVWR